MNKILIVEDESLVALDLSQTLSEAGYEIVGIASNGKDAIALACKHEPDVVLMDILLKGDIDGIETARKIKIKQNPAVIFLTALKKDTDIERAIEVNPSAYLIKPFEKKALFIALKIALSENRDKNLLQGDILLDDAFSFDSSSQQLICKGQFINLTKKERQLLSLLIESANTIVTFYDIENTIWPEKSSNINTIRALISHLRSKLNYKFIETISGIGYRITLLS